MFDQLIGNDRVKHQLRRLLAQRRVPNSLLFTGPDGVGKRSFALELARAFLCADPKYGEGCGECSVCRRVVSFDIPRPEKKDDFKRVFFSEHPDVGMLVPFNRNLLVDAVRALEGEANFRPYEGQVRVFIIENADKMNDAASNALLKTLEEPPSTSHIVLVTSRPDCLLPTILSRCQVIRFAPVPADGVERFLIDSGRFDDFGARLAARLSNGSVGRAVDMDVEAYRARRELMFDLLQNVAGRPDRAALLQASELLCEPKNKNDFEWSLDILQSLIRDVWTLKQTGSIDVVTNFDLAHEMERVGPALSESDLSQWLLAIEELLERVDVNINRRIAADALFMEMAA